MRGYYERPDDSDTVPLSTCPSPCPHVAGHTTQHCEEARRLAQEVERLTAELAATKEQSERRKKGLDLTLSLLENIAKAESLADIQVAIFTGMADALILAAETKEVKL